MPACRCRKSGTASVHARSSNCSAGTRGLLLRLMTAFSLERFVTAQDRVIEQVIAELRSGRKRTHWMWFVFPQIAGLGYSATSERYALSSLDEARAYIAHPVLGLRLQNCTELVLANRTRAIRDVFDFPDNLKFHSCMTLFAYAGPGAPEFRAALDKYFEGREDTATLAKLGF